MEDCDKNASQPCRSTARWLKRELPSSSEGLRAEIKEVLRQDGESIKEILDVLAKDVEKSTRRKTTDVEDVVEALLGSPSLTPQMAITILEHE